MAGTLARRAAIVSRHGRDRRRPRDRDLVRLHLTVLPHRGAPRGVAGAPVRRSAHLVAVRSAPRVPARGDPARRSRGALRRGLRRPHARDVRGRGPGVRAAARRRLEHAPRARARRGRRARRDCTAPTTTASWTPTGPRASISRSAPRSSSSRATSASRMPASSRRSTIASGSGPWTTRPRRAQAAGATGVPAFVIDWRLLVVGAQPRELLAQAIAQARALAADDSTPRLEQA